MVAVFSGYSPFGGCGYMSGCHWCCNMQKRRTKNGKNKNQGQNQSTKQTPLQWRRTTCTPPQHTVVFPLYWSRTIQTDNHTIHMEKPAVKTNIQTMTTSLLSINLRALANKTDSNPMLTNTANTMDPLIKGAVVRSLAVWLIECVSKPPR